MIPMRPLLAAFAAGSLLVGLAAHTVGLGAVSDKAMTEPGVTIRLESAGIIGSIHRRVHVQPLTTTNTLSAS
jgi:hypothetical protein